MYVSADQNIFVKFKLSSTVGGKALYSKIITIINNFVGHI